MGYLTTSAKIALEGFNDSLITVPTGVTYANVVDNAIVKASLRLKRWVGTTNYSSADAEINTPPPPAVLSDMAQSLQLAETFITISELMGYVLPEKMNNIGSYTIVGAVAEAISAADLGNGNVNYMKFFIDKAEMYCQQYIISSGEDIMIARRSCHHGL